MEYPRRVRKARYKQKVQPVHVWNILRCLGGGTVKLCTIRACMEYALYVRIVIGNRENYYLKDYQETNSGKQNI